jgi:hypothetical protein
VSEITSAATPVAEGTRPPRWLLVPLGVFAAFALAAGLVARGREELPGNFRLGHVFTTQFHLMTWLSMAAALFACLQLVTAAWIFRKLPWPRPDWIPAVHRWTGRLTQLTVAPDVYWCIFQLGFQTYDTRYVAHSVLGTLFVGFVASKVTIVRLHRFPVWVYPLAGLLVFATLIGAWWTSALWFVRQAGNTLF